MDNTPVHYQSSKPIEITVLSAFVIIITNMALNQITDSQDYP